MTGAVFATEDFSAGDDTLIYTPGGDPFLVFGGVQAAALSSDGLVVTGLGDDTIVGYSGYLVISDDDEQQNLVIEPEAVLIGVDLTDDLNMSDALLTPQITALDGDISDDDTLIGVVSAARSEGVTTEIIAVGLQAAGRDVRTGIGNDIILGAALTFDVDFSVGVDLEGGTVRLGDGDDILVGIAITESVDTTGSGLVGASLDTVYGGTGNEIIAGVALGQVGGSRDHSLVGLEAGLISLASEDDDPGDQAVVLGIAGLIGLPDAETAPDSIAMGKSGGLVGALISTGGNNDIVTGISFAVLGDDGSFASNSGVRAADIQAGGGSNIIVGISYAEMGLGAAFDFNVGIKTSEIETGDDADVVIGVVYAELEGASSIEDNAGIMGSFDATNYAFSTGGGADLIAGIGEVLVDGTPAGGASGMVNVSLDSGDENDIVIGLGSSGFGRDASASYGIANINTHEGGTGPSINLGEGDDFVFARGLTAGVRDVFMFGGTGNDVFDVQNGTGEISGGADTDTLILAGDFSDFLFFFVGDDRGDADVADGVRIETGQEFLMELTVFEIEFFQFDDQTVAYGDLVFVM